MGYFVTTKSRQTEGVTLFLVNRNHTKTKWWTEVLDEAIHFRKKSAAEYSCNNLRFNDPNVIDLQNAIQMEQKNEKILKE